LGGFESGCINNATENPVAFIQRTGKSLWKSLEQSARTFSKKSLDETEVHENICCNGPNLLARANWNSDN